MGEEFGMKFPLFTAPIAGDSYDRYSRAAPVCEDLARFANP
jgi:hypothetical protein